MRTSAYASELVINGTTFCPVHLSAEEISIILDTFIANIGDITYLKAFVRKTMSKGIEFKVLQSNNAIKGASSQPTNKEYSIVIQPNWNIEILDHWLSMNIMPRCEKLDAEDLSKFLWQSILNRKNDLDAVEVNSIFKKEGWVLVRKIQDEILI